MYYFFYEKQQKIWNLVFSFMYLVSVYPMDRTYVSKQIFKVNGRQNNNFPIPEYIYDQ